MASANPFHLGWFMGGYRVHGWRDTWIGTTAHQAMHPEFYVDFARQLERACFDYFIIEDSSFVPDGWQGKHDWYVENTYHVPKYDPSVLASILSQTTSRLGIVPTLAITEYPPYLLARLMSTLDHVSKGRAGWNMVTASSDRAAQNYGHDGQPEHDVRYAMATEFTQLVQALWDSWEPGSMLVDPENGIFADPSKVHTVDFEGRFYKSRGPINTARSPQGRPVIVQAGGSSTGRHYASTYADTVIASATSIEGMKEYRDDIRARMIAQGRKPGECKVLFLVSPTIGETEEEALGKKQRRLALAAEHPEIRLAGIGYTSDIDFSALDLDVPISTLLDKLVTNGHQSSLDAVIKGNEHRTLREVASSQASSGARVELLGTPDQVAGKMDEIMQEVGGDGFLFSLETLTRRSIAEMTEGLVPALQRRGLTRTGYSYEQFRDNLLEF